MKSLYLLYNDYIIYIEGGKKENRRNEKEEERTYLANTERSWIISLRYNVCLSQHGTPPLLIAAGCGNIQIIEVLMRKGAEIQANDKVMIARMLLSGRFWLTAAEINIGKGVSCRLVGFGGGVFFFSIDKCNHEPGALCWDISKSYANAMMQCTDALHLPDCQLLNGKIIKWICRTVKNCFIFEWSHQFLFCCFLYILNYF